MQKLIYITITRILVKRSSLYLEYKNKWFGIKSDFSADIDIIRAQDIRF